MLSILVGHLHKGRPFKCTFSAFVLSSKIFMYFFDLLQCMSFFPGFFYEAVTRVNNTLCFNCQDASSPEKCDTVDICNYDEV